MGKFVVPKDDRDKLVLGGDADGQMAIDEKENRSPAGGRQFSVPLVGKNHSTCFCNYFY